jgi:hypothetical protein
MPRTNGAARLPPHWAAKVRALPVEAELIAEVRDQLRAEFLQRTMLFEREVRQEMRSRGRGTFDSERLHAIEEHLVGIHETLANLTERIRALEARPAAPDLRLLSRRKADGGAGERAIRRRLSA